MSWTSRLAVHEVASRRSTRQAPQPVGTARTSETGPQQRAPQVHRVTVPCFLARQRQGGFAFVAHG